MNGIPFDPRRKTIPHEFGCVMDNGEPVPGLYVAGWAKRGPVGIIDATLRDTKETFGVLRHHIETNQLKESTFDGVNEIVNGKYVGFEEWLKVD